MLVVENACTLLHEACGIDTCATSPVQGSVLLIVPVRVTPAESVNVTPLINCDLVALVGLTVPELTVNPTDTVPVCPEPNVPFTTCVPAVLL